MCSSKHEDWYISVGETIIVFRLFFVRVLGVTEVELKQRLILHENLCCRQITQRRAKLWTEHYILYLIGGCAIVFLSVGATFVSLWYLGNAPDDRHHEQVVVNTSLKLLLGCTR